MSGAGVEFHNVSKKFKRGELHDSLRDLIPAVAKRVVGRGPPADELEGSEFWAVRDVSFSVKPGEALGIIGHNGAGKSTILKLLTRILKPTRGYSEVRGRVGALIEIAAGFHGDLTGRENIFLQGSILGMRRAEIARKLDEIVEFSGISEFIDTPVKRYSSGMNARLGFSIAAHIDPEVLIIDEVLSVGDYGFQKKAFGRIESLCTSGIPVVLVTHQLPRVAELCTKAILLDHGQVITRGTSQECIDAYISGEERVADLMATDCPIAIEELTVDSPLPVRSGEHLRLRITGAVVDGSRSGNLSVGLQVRSLETGQRIFATGTEGCQIELPSAGTYQIETELQMNVPPGVYSLESSVWDTEQRQDLGKGPSAMVRVQEGASFWGTVQLNPRMHLLGESLPTAAAGTG